MALFSGQRDTSPQHWPDVSKIKYHATVYQGHQRRRYWLMFTKEDHEPSVSNITLKERDTVPVNFINSKWNLSKSLAPNEMWKRAPNSALTKHLQLWRQGWARTGSRGPQLATSHLRIIQLFSSWGSPGEVFAPCWLCFHHMYNERFE